MCTRCVDGVVVLDEVDGVVVLDVVDGVVVLMK